MRIQLFKILILFFLLLIACNSNPEISESELSTSNGNAISDDIISVKTIIISTGVFHKEIKSNGKLHALEKADLFFKTTERINRINVKNGTQVQKGQIIATLSNEHQTIVLRKAKDLFQKALLNRDKELIEYGYNPNDSTSISAESLRIINIRSGFNEAQTNLLEAEVSYNHTILKAPFSGIIANLEFKEQNTITSTNKFCTLINDSKFEVEFQVLETEFQNIKLGGSVKIVPFASNNQELSSTITEINPIVDENGLIIVTSLISNNYQGFFDGMNTNVIIESDFINTLSVPKSAVIIRSDQNVVFTYQNGLAKWKYVTISAENSTSYLISEGLQTNDTVITTNNFNLTHDSQVKRITN